MKRGFPGDAAVAVKSLQLCPTLCDPIDGSPPSSAVPGILQARTLEWVDISFPNLEPVCCFTSCSNCCFLTYTPISQEAGQVVWYSHLLKNFPQFVIIHTVKGLSEVNEEDIFLGFSCFFYDPTDVGNLISGCAFSKFSLNICKFSVHVLLKPILENFVHDFASM